MFGVRHNLLSPPASPTSTISCHTFYSSHPHSSSIIGRFQILKDLSHPNLCALLDISKTPNGNQTTTSKKLTIMERGVTHATMSLKNVMVDGDDVKLSNYEMDYITDHGRFVTFPVGVYATRDVAFTAGKGSRKADVWALGILLMELRFGETVFSFDRRDIDAVIEGCVKMMDDGMRLFLERLGDDECDALIKDCLCVDVRGRPDIMTLRNRYAGYLDVTRGEKVTPTWGDVTFPTLFYLWKVMGNDVESELKRQGVVLSCPSMDRVPLYVSSKADVEVVMGVEESSTTAFTNRDIFIEFPDCGDGGECATPPPEEAKGYMWKGYERFSGKSVEMVLRNGEVKHGGVEIVREAGCDVPPREDLGGDFGVKGDPEVAYEQIDKEAEHSIDRQLDLDIPRCHQYSELLASPVGHAKLRRILKAWSVTEPALVYWQGLDSLLAPFLTLNFNNEGFAFDCFRRECVNALRWIVNFLDPELGLHLHEIGLTAELFAIPWFMTMFAHILPLDRVYLLWDTLLTGPDTLFLFVGYAILKQFRETLLARDFNNCMVLFSELPTVDVERCILNAVQAFNCTPPSLVATVERLLSLDDLSEGLGAVEEGRERRRMELCECGEGDGCGEYCGLEDDCGEEWDCCSGCQEEDNDDDNDDGGGGGDDIDDDGNGGGKKVKAILYIILTHL
ncbi:rab-GTPase-TBC domain-containing protein [Chytridium lagenaria]|nr:rab-GTPase-TBC domain-containing protein [Chytridium lagenaria]